MKGAVASSDGAFLFAATHPLCCYPSRAPERRKLTLPRSVENRHIQLALLPHSLLVAHRVLLERTMEFETCEDRRGVSRNS